MMRLSTVFAVLLVTICSLHAQMTWKPLMQPLAGGFVENLDLGSNGMIYGRMGPIVLLSRDQGALWEEITRITDVDPQAPARLTLAVLKGGSAPDRLVLYPSNGNGDMWVNIRPSSVFTKMALPAQLAGKDFSLFGLSNGIVFALITTSNDSTTILRSDDHGETWTTEITLPGDFFNRTTEGPDGSLLCGDGWNNLLYRRTADGRWTELAMPDEARIDAWAMGGSVVVARADTVVYRSVDAGTTWENMNAGFDHSFKQGFGFSETMTGLPNGDIIYTRSLGNEHTRIQYLERNAMEWATMVDSLPMDLEKVIAISSSRIMATDESGPLISDDQGATWKESVAGLHVVPVWRFAIGGETIIAASVNGDLYRGNVTSGAWDAVRVTPLPRSSGDFPIGDVVALGNGVFLADSRRQGILRSTDDGKTWTLVAECEGYEDGLGSGSRFVVRGNVIYTTLRHAIAASVDAGATWRTLYRNDTVNMWSMAERTASDLVITANQALYEYHAGGAASFYKIWDFESANVLLSIGSWDTFRMVIIGGDENDGILRLMRPMEGFMTPEVYDIKLGMTMDLLLFDYMMIPNGDVYLTTAEAIWRLQGDQKYVERFPNEGIVWSMALGWHDTYGLMRSTVLGDIEYAGAAVSVDDDVASNEGTFGVYPNPASTRATVRTTRVSGLATADVIDMMGNTLHSAVVDIVDGRASLDVATLPSGTYRLRIRNHDAIISTQLGIVR